MESSARHLSQTFADYTAVLDVYRSLARSCWDRQKHLLVLNLFTVGLGLLAHSDRLHSRVAFAVASLASIASAVVVWRLGRRFKEIVETLNRLEAELGWTDLQAAGSAARSSTEASARIVAALFAVYAILEALAALNWSS